MRERVQEIPDLELWDAHMKCKRRMISYLRSIFTENWIERGFSPARVRRAREMLNAGFLTIGFARRFATYKRADLILRDKERLARILKNERRPCQILFAGKAHPADIMAKKIITRHLRLRPRVRSRGPHLLYRELRAVGGRAPRPGVRPVAEQPDPAERSLRDVGDEGRASTGCST